ncbi:small ribosomal subunit protein eS4, X isoform-like [Dama dama]|uniref:small ribosomal subunit protein eS4, X isoform-like n=1 Tax=Dama dama TaxID=30532 RepID=UPI002A3628F1|nr:small ribosomal subunit protein eS4, X isoform-like [Dama dama]
MAATVSQQLTQEPAAQAWRWLALLSESCSCPGRLCSTPPRPCGCLGNGVAPPCHDLNVQSFVTLKISLQMELLVPRSEKGVVPVHIRFGLQNKTVLPAPELIGKMYIQQVGTGDVGHTPQQPTYFLLAEIVEQSEKVGKKAGLQNIEAPKHWMLDKLTGVFAPCPSTASHKLRECLPLIIFLKSRFKYALTGDEMKKICMQHFIKIKGKVHTNTTYPTVFMNVISVDKIGENFHLIYDTKDRFAVHCIERQPFSIIPEEAKYKLCKVRKIFVGIKGIPHLVTHDARTIHYPNPLIKVNDTIQIDLGTGKITDFIKFDTGNLCMMMGGANLGRICVITNRERHPGSFDVVHVKDANGNNFATWLSNIFIIGKGNIRWISLPRGKGICLTIAEERDKRLAAKQSSG